LEAAREAPTRLNPDHEHLKRELRLAEDRMIEKERENQELVRRKYLN
jgi:hypothetical protein